MRRKAVTLVGDGGDVLSISKPRLAGDEPQKDSTSLVQELSNCRVTMEAKLLSSILSLHLLPDNQALVAQDALERFGSIGAVFRTPPMDLFADEALGSAAVSNIDFVKQLIFNETSAPLKSGHIFANFDKLIYYLRLRAGRLPHEHARVLSLDAKSRLIDDKVVSNGNTASVRIDIRTVMCLAVRMFATSIVLVHNHPSGDPSPSQDDLDLTRDMVSACDLVGVILADHVIIAGERWYSFRLSGAL